MAGTPYLVDSNVLLRWVKPDDRDYPLVVSAIDATLQRGAVFCYTSQNGFLGRKPVPIAVKWTSTSVPEFSNVLLTCSRTQHRAGE